MITVVYGGSGSGKSEYAENLAIKRFEEAVREEADREKAGREGSVSKEASEYNAFKKNSRLIYAAAMRVWDEEGRERVEKHRRNRYGKGFTTIEIPTDIEKLDCDGSDIILLEDLSNLVMNEYYDLACDVKSVKEKIITQLDKVHSRCRELIIVSNDIFSDGITYSDEVETYKKLFAEINRNLCEKANQVTEIVAGIPVRIK